MAEPVFHIGRAGYDIAMAHPSQIQISSGPDGRVLNISGFIKDTATLADAKALRDQLTRQAKTARQSGFVSVHSDVDPTIDGYYILENANVSIGAQLGSLQGEGFFPYSATLTERDTQMFETVISGAFLSNDISETEGNSEPFHSPPAGATSLWPIGGTARLRDIDGADVESEQILLVEGIVPPEVPIWTCPPKYFLEGGARLRIGGVTYTGIPYLDKTPLSATEDAPLADGEWELTNQVFRIKGMASPDHGFTIEIWNTDTDAWESPTSFDLYRNGGQTSLITWDHLTVLRNDPEEVTIRLISTSLTSGIGRESLDVSLRRGSHFARCHYSVSGYISTSLGVGREATDAATSFTYGVHDAANDSDGNRWVLGSRHTSTKDTTNGRLTQTASGLENSMEFFVGHELGGTGADTADTALRLGRQYIYHIRESVAPILASGISL